MLIRQSRRTGWARQFGTSTGSAAAAHTKQQIPPWLEVEGRTRSFLFDKDNPVVNKEAHKLHKTHISPAAVKANPGLGEVLKNEEVQAWQTNPYLSMIASPIRRCMWSDRAMPNEFLIAIKAASYNIATDNPQGSIPGNPSSQKSKSAIFPRGLLHPAFSDTDGSRGRKEDRGYVVCRKIALHIYNTKGGRKKFEKADEHNPLLIYQTESFLRQRILQELQLIADLPPAREQMEKEGQGSTSIKNDNTVVPGKEDSLYSLPQSLLQGIQSDGSSSQEKLKEHLSPGPPLPTKLNPPAALLLFSDTPPNKSIIPKGQLSTLIPYQSENLEGYDLQQLAKHRIPIYSVPRIFQLDPPEEIEPETSQKKVDQHDPGTSWNVVRRNHPTIYEREVKACQDQLLAFQKAVRSLATSVGNEQGLQYSVIAVPSMSAAMVPLLKALWRYRMWIGEGWSGDGLGVLEATGRK